MYKDRFRINIQIYEKIIKIKNNLIKSIKNNFFENFVESIKIYKNIDKLDKFQNCCKNVRECQKLVKEY